MSEILQKILMQGMWVRPECLRLIRNRTISTSEHLCLMYIDSIIILSGDFFSMSNPKLAKYLRIKERQIALNLSHLKELGLIIYDKQKRRKRRIITLFQILDAKKLRKKSGKKGLLQKKGAINCISPPFDSVRCNKLHPCYKSTYYISFLEEKNKKNRSFCTGAINYTLDFSTPSLFKRKKYHPRWKTYARKLAKAIQSLKGYEPNYMDWYKSLEKIHAQHGAAISRIRKVLEWYCKILEDIEEGDEQWEYLPHASTGAQFLGKFLAIEYAMKKEERRIRKFKEKDRVPGGPTPIVEEIIEETDENKEDWQE